MKNSKELPHHENFSRHLGLGEVELCFTDANGPYSYFRMVNEQRIPAMRAFAAKDVFQELEFKVDKRMLSAYFEAVKDAANAGKLGHIYLITEEIQERSEYITHIDLLYKVASVLYFDQTENPYTYDPVYGYEKINRWKSDRSINDFFLETPINEYLPFSDLSKIDLAYYTRAQVQKDVKLAKAILKTLSETNKTGETGKELQSLMETLENWNV